MASVALVGSLALTACGSDNNDRRRVRARRAPAAGRGGLPRGGGTLNAEGSSAQKNAIEEAISSFQDACDGTTVNYNPTGSGAGIKQFIAGQVDFAGSDSALKTEEKDGKVEADDAASLLRLAGVEPADGHRPDRGLLQREGRRQARPHPRGRRQHLQRQDHHLERHSRSPPLNSGATLPAEPIKVFFRSDESGTTENFTKYLKAAAPTAWTAEPGKKWTGKGEGKEKSDGVAGAVKATEGGITYAEWSYAKDNKLGIAQIDNGGGAGRAHRRVGRQGRRWPPRPTARATTCASSSTTPPRRPAPTRSSWSPTRSSAPRARTPRRRP